MTRVRRRGFLLAFLLGGGRGLRAADGLELVMFERLGCPTKSFGDSTGVLSV